MEKGIPGLVTEYFTYKKIYTVSLFLCAKSDEWRFTKQLSSTGTSWRVIEIENAKYKSASTLWPEILRPQHHQQGVFLDYGCENGRQTLRKISFYNASYNWLVWSNDSLPEKAMTLVNLSIDTDMTWATPGSNISIILTDVYKINSTLPSVVTTPAGTWNRITYQLRYHLTAYKYLRRSNLNGLLFNAAVVVSTGATENLEEELGSREHQNLGSSISHNFALYKELQLMYNFTLRLHAAKSGGYSNSSGRFSGLMGMLQRGEADIGVCSVLPSPKIHQIVDFTGHTWKFRSAMLFLHPEISDVYTLLTPFTTKVWLFVLFTWALAVITMWVINVAEAKSVHQQEERSWSNTLLAVIGAVSEQGSEMESKWISWRVAYLVILIQVVVLNGYYGACMVSNLLQPPTSTIKTIQDLINSELEAGYVTSRINQDMFASLLDPAVKELYDKKLKMHPVDSVHLALSKLRYEKFAVYDEAIALYPGIEKYFSNDEKCSLEEIKLFPPIMAYSVVRKGSPYREMFVYGFLKLMERGVVNHEVLYWRPPAPRCQYMDKPKRINMNHVSIAFFIFTAGTLLAVAIFFCERLLFLGPIHIFSNIRYWQKKMTKVA